MRALSPLDAGFIATETRATPMHVGSLLLLRPPPGASKDFLTDLFQEWVSEKASRPPFDQHLVYPASRFGLPQWDLDPDFDLEYHLRHSALPAPGRYRELFALVSRLHGTLLDRTRPLWEFHLIEGLSSGQFAVYTKMHHAQVDGMAAMRFLQATLSEDPDERGVPLPWASDGRGWKRAKPASTPSGLAVAAAAEALQSQLGLIPNVARALSRTATAFQKPADERMAYPFEGPRSPLNTKVSAARRFVAQSYSMDRIHRVREAFSATVNDIVLAMCSSALRRYLQEYGGGVPDRPLTAMTPISVRPKDADDFGNAMSAVLVNLATHIGDPVRRLHTVQASMRDGRSVIKELTFDEVVLYTALMSTPLMLPALLGLGALFPPTNVVISNVPGPRQPMYWNGAKLEGMYPVSIVYHGVAVNITVTSYAGSLDFGIVACRRSVPRVQRIIDFLEEGLVELEQAAGVAATERLGASRGSSVARA
jgi:diacylglycerol O-acyltransferase